MVTSIRTHSLSHSSHLLDTYTSIVKALLRRRVEHIKQHPSLEPPSNFDDLSLFSGCLMKQACKDTQSRRYAKKIFLLSSSLISLSPTPSLSLSLSPSLSLSLSSSLPLSLPPFSPLLLRLFAIHLGASLEDCDPGDLPSVLLTHQASLHLIAVLASSLGYTIYMYNERYFSERQFSYSVQQKVHKQDL